MTPADPCFSGSITPAAVAAAAVRFNMPFRSLASGCFECRLLRRAYDVVKFSLIPANNMLSSFLEDTQEDGFTQASPRDRASSNQFAGLGRSLYTGATSYP
jgi:hypothetical protein